MDNMVRKTSKKAKASRKKKEQPQASTKEAHVTNGSLGAALGRAFHGGDSSGDKGKTIFSGIQQRINPSRRG
jgi:hypothetical protein